MLLTTGVALQSHAREFSAIDPGKQHDLSTNAAFVMHGILQEMGVGLPPEDRNIDPPTPIPGPNPPPAPEPDIKEFFDDSFFDEDSSFDEAVERMDTEFEETVTAWDAEYEKTVAKWEKAREAFLEKEAAYQAAEIPIQATAVTLQSSPGRYTANLQAMETGQFHVIPNALDLDIKNQAGRGTCTAFSGVRALETILIQYDVRTDLSEQYFYYLSKPACQITPCGKKQEGSSIDGGLLATRSTRQSAVMPERFCPYIPFRNDNNITNSPLASCNTGGAVRAGRLVRVTSFPQLLNELRNNHPVVAGYTLSRSYYRNRGLVRHHDPINETKASGSDAGGHANLIVGYVKLPPSLSREGDFCVIAANSWELGWGRGGYSCLTQKWLSNHDAHFAALQSVVVTEAGLEYYQIR